MMQLDTFRIGLILTERCNITCAHCWLSSGPDRHKSMRLGDALRYVEEAAELPGMEWISVTGGEPFLLYDEMLTIIRHASELGLKTECVTNCYWAVNQERAEEKLRELMEAGLDVIDISVDDFHQRFIPFERVRNCYEAAKRLGLKVVIQSVYGRSSRLRLDEIIRRLGDGGIRVLGPRPRGKPLYAIAIESGFIPIGRGAMIPREEWPLGSGPVEGPCQAVLRDISISPDGRLLPCCSALSLLPQASIGTLTEKGLRELLEEALEMELLRWLREVGPMGIAEKIGFNLNPEGYVNRCHLCYEVLRNAYDFSPLG
ncbi:radical SAM protein [Candidatus Bathyarchaeota archaeon]|nr:radical SAM protein [Candidatus Bathyarchaeota archaeon]